MEILDNTEEHQEKKLIPTYKENHHSLFWNIS